MKNLCKKSPYCPNIAANTGIFDIVKSVVPTQNVTGSNYIFFGVRTSCGRTPVTALLGLCCGAGCGYERFMATYRGAPSSVDIRQI